MMWPLPQQHHERVCILANEHTLVCSWWSLHKERPLLRGYMRYALTTELHNGTINNFSRIIEHIEHFLSTYRIKKQCTALVALAGAGIAERYIAVPTAHPTRKQLENAHLKQCVWDYRYVCPHQDMHLFYASGMHRALLFQYQLLALQAHLDVTLLTSQFCAELAFYKHLQGATFRRSKLAHDLNTHGNTLTHIATSDSLYRSVSFDPRVRIRVSDEAAYIAPLAGLYLT